MIRYNLFITAINIEPFVRTAGEIRVLISQELVSQMEASQNGIREMLSLAEVLDVLRMQISIVECDAFAYLSIEGDLVILVAPVTSPSTPLQVSTVL